MIRKNLRGISKGRILDEGKMCKDVWSFSNHTEVSPPPFCLCKGCLLLIVLCIANFWAVIRWTLGGAALESRVTGDATLFYWPDYNFILILCKQ